MGYILAKMCVLLLCVCGYMADCARREEDVNEGDEPHGHVTSISVLRSYRRLGLAKRLMIQSRESWIDTVRCFELTVRVQRRRWRQCTRRRTCLYTFASPTAPPSGCTAIRSGSPKRTPKKDTVRISLYLSPMRTRIVLTETAAHSRRGRGGRVCDAAVAQALRAVDARRVMYPYSARVALDIYYIMLHSPRGPTRLALHSGLYWRLFSGR